MVGFNIKGAKKLFFDAQKVVTAAEKAERRALSKFGAFVRTTAKRSIRKARQKKIAELTPEERRSWEIRKEIGKRKGFKARRPLKASEPGEPHRYRAGLIKKHIFFLWDKANKSVIIGPARLSKRGDAPHDLEFGGNTTLTAGPDRGKRITIKPRPTMQLAMQKELPGLPEMWKDAVR